MNSCLIPGLKGERKLVLSPLVTFYILNSSDLRYSKIRVVIGWRTYSDTQTIKHREGEVRPASEGCREDILSKI